MRPLLLLLIVCTIIPVSLKSQQGMTVLFLNTENLFDPADDPQKDDDAYTTDGDYQHWDNRDNLIVSQGVRCIWNEDAKYKLPISLKAGDKLYWLSTGAYTSTYASVAFNGFPPIKTYFMR